MTTPGVRCRLFFFKYFWHSLFESAGAWQGSYGQHAWAEYEKHYRFWGKNKTLQTLANKIEGNISEHEIIGKATLIKHLHFDVR